MKKLFAILLLVVYTNTAFGLTFHFHYCNGRLVGTSLANLENKISCGSKECGNKCCEDEVKIVKLDNHKLTIPPEFKDWLTGLHLHTSEDAKYSPLESHDTYFFVRLPHRSQQIEIFILTRNLRI